MLTQLTINNFAIVDNLSIDFNHGMTAITGETGAGKSISVDALSLCLGARSDASFVRYDCERVDISAHFLLDNTPSALNWLLENQLDEHNECILRRVITKDGRSKAFINGRAVPISQLKDLGHMLIQIYGQHEHQKLMNHDYQLQLLDQYMNDNMLLSQMKKVYIKWRLVEKEYEVHQQLCQERNAHAQLLQYQLKELNEFLPIKGEYEQIDEEYKRLANSEKLIHLGTQLVDLLENNPDFNILNQLNKAKNRVQELTSLDTKITNVADLLEEGAIQIIEASYEINRYVESLSIDPSRIIELEQRIAKYIALARKHHANPENLATIHQQLLTEFEQISNQDEISEQLKQDVEHHYQQALSCAKKLHQNRIQVAQVLAEKITQSIRELSIPHGEFEINIVWDDQKITESGADKIAFLVSTNPGQSMQLINKVASGGELSRIALAVQVLTAQKMETPALIFDEIDVGISGPTAAKVGHLLRKLGESTQVITVTHLPQVAGNAHQHYFVSKQTDGKQTNTKMNILNRSQRLHELARLLGGDKITENTLANAEELLIAG